MANGNFLQLALPKRYNMPGGYESRTFKVGEPVALRIPRVPEITYGTYVGSYAPENDKIASHIVHVNHPRFGPIDQYVHWYEVGKIPQHISSTTAHVVAKNKGLPENIARKLSTYGGKSKRRKIRSRKTKTRHH
jgi:hypothetical protein